MENGLGEPVVPAGSADRIGAPASGPETYMKILVVSDAPSDLAFVRARLAAEPVTVSCATSGWEALAAARGDPPDLVLLEERLPDLASAEVCRQLQARPGTAAAQVLFLIDAGDARAKQRALDLGAVDFVTKPLDAAELRARVRGALRLQRLGELLRRHARIDPLTELADRGALDARMAVEWARRERHGGPLSAVLLDPDGLEHLTGTYGRGVGDEALRAVARALRATVRPADLAARFDSRRFAVLLPETGRDGAASFAHRCRAAIAALSLPVNGHAVPLGASFGVAAAVGRPSPEALVAAAAAALEHARSCGPGQVAVHDGSGAALETPA
jgi:diguanylate cyclase (GGDEF)-like protein